MFGESAAIRFVFAISLLLGTLTDSTVGRGNNSYAKFATNLLQQRKQISIPVVTTWETLVSGN